MLPLMWIDRIFDKLTLAYGVEFLNKWKGVPIADVKTEWAERLSGFAKDSASIVYALDHLPTDRPVNVLQFLALCRSAPAPEGLPRIEHKVNPEIAKKAIQAMQSSIAPQAKVGTNHAWAYAIQAKDRLNPKSVSPTVREIYKAVVLRYPDSDKQFNENVEIMP